jgi:H+/Cl- antiporter ClcA
VALLAGSASAAFLFALDWATAARDANPVLILWLPAAGLAVGFLYHALGRDVEAGNNLLLDEIQNPSRRVPFRMAPLVLLGTILSHLCGGSVGREGTAVQMGGALADQLSPLLRLDKKDRRLLLMAGMSGGFASVFGTPLAGAIFGFEVLAIGAMSYEAILPCFFAAVLADQVASAWGVHHTLYSAVGVPPMTGFGFLAAMIAGVAFGLTAKVFARLIHALSAAMRRLIAYAPLRPCVGGAVVAAALLLFGAERYAGLGLPVIQQAFEQPVYPWDFAVKGLFTIASLGSGLKGGEVTPLFFLGATLGNALAPLLHLPLSLLAAMGFAAVFGGAANTPLAATVLAMELFGAECASYVAIACVVSYHFSGHRGIYRSQRLAQSKSRHEASGPP